jgi:hypothetical protein
MFKRKLIVHLALLLLVFALLSQCKAKYGAKRIPSSVEASQPEQKPEQNSKYTPVPRQKPSPRPEIESAKSIEPEAYSEREVVKNSEVDRSTQNRFPSADPKEQKTAASNIAKSPFSAKSVNDDYAGIKATLGISYFKSIRQYETKDLRVTAIFNGDAKLVRKKIRDIEAVEYEFVPKEDSSTIQVVKDITLFKKLKIALHYDKADFTVSPVPQDAKEEQELDFESGNDWHWTVRAVAVKPHPAIVKVEIFGETHKGDFKLIALKEVEIKIDITQTDTFWSKARQWPGDHLDYIIESLIVPFIIYLWKRRKKSQDIP